MKPLVSLSSAVRDFWLEPARPDGLAFLRIAISLMALVQLAVLWPHLPALYGNYGFVQWVVTEVATDTWFPSLGKVALAVAPWGVSWKVVLYSTFGSYGLALVALLAGYRTRVAATIAWITHALTLNNGYFSVYGMDTMLHILFFYLVFFPSGGRWSLDARAGRASGAPSASARIALRTLQLHLCIIYLNTGTGKMAGDQWWTGEAIWRALMQPQFGAFDFSFLAPYGGLLTLACWGVLLLETGYPFFVWVPSLRRPWLAATVGMHLGIAITMKLWLFGITMIVFNLAAFAFTRAAPALAPAREPSPEKAAPSWGPAAVPVVASR